MAALPDRPIARAIVRSRSDACIVTAPLTRNATAEDQHSVKERDVMKKAVIGSAALLLFAAAGDVLAAGSSSTTADAYHCYLFGMVPKDSPHALLQAAASGNPPVDHFFQFMANGRTPEEVRGTVASYVSGLPERSTIVQSQGNVGYVGILDGGQVVKCSCP
jgi:hypothetical protein